ncbi:MAG: TonB-dependent receptor plug domain-containing protein [Gemmatimonadales bacterium]
MSRALKLLVPMMLVLGSIGCASAPKAGTTPKLDHSVLTPADFQDRHYPSAYEIVEALRSNWMNTRGADSFYSPSVVLVYLDNVKLGSIETLRTIEPSVIARIEHFDGPAATARWGVGHAGGVILISTSKRLQD